MLDPIAKEPTMRIQRRMNRAAFSLTELLIVLSLAALTLSLMMPAVLNAQGAANRRQSINNLKDIGIALHNCNDTFRKLPPAHGKLGNVAVDATIHVHLLPFIEQDNAYKKYFEEKGGDKVQKFTIRTFSSELDPSHKDKDEGVQNFAANLRVFADIGVQTPFDQDIAPGQDETFKGGSRIPATFVDGTSNTIVYSTKFAICGEGGSRYAPEPRTKFAAFFAMNAATEKASPTSAKATFQLVPSAKECVCTPPMAQSFEKAGILVALGDASVRTVSATISFQTWNMAVQPNDGKVLGDDWND
jgi:type II secretory pathway pseudopilin PulG